MEQSHYYPDRSPTDTLSIIYVHACVGERRSRLKPLCGAHFCIEGSDRIHHDS